MIILYIDDNPDDLYMVRQIGADCGHIITTLKDGEYINKHSIIPDCVKLILLDLEMPGQDGITTLEILQLIAPEVPVYVLSGSIQYKDLCLAKGATHFISKDIRNRNITHYLTNLA